MVAQLNKAIPDQPTIVALYYAQSFKRCETDTVLKLLANTVLCTVRVCSWDGNIVEITKEATKQRLNHIHTDCTDTQSLGNAKKTTIRVHVDHIE